MYRKINFKINDISYSITILLNKQLTILEACLKNGIYIPHFCYNKYLSIAGNCRICIIEVEKFIKPIISCLNLCIENLSIYTNSFSIKKYRENVLEFLLINHPLDCPICDQAGECDLQEQTIKYGLDKTRYFLKKKTNIDIYLNNYIKLILNRCILCLRCVRYLNQENLNKILGNIGRGFHSKIHIYNNNIITNIGSSNIIDICPVGALTFKIKQFNYRPWELTYMLFFDLFDAFALPIKIDFKDNKIVRILPFLDSIFFKDFISDLSRYKTLYFLFLLLEKKNKIIYFKNETFNNIIFNLFKNCLISIIYIKNLYIQIKSKFKLFKSIVFNYFDFNNNYLLFINNIKKKKIILNKSLEKYMYRFFLFLSEINNIFKNIFFFNIEDLKFLNVYLSFIDIIYYTSIKNQNKNKESYFYINKYLNFFNILLNFDNLFIFNLKNYTYNINKNIFFNIINDIYNSLKNINFNIFNISNLFFTFNNYIFNILGINFFKNINLKFFSFFILFYFINNFNFYNIHGYPFTI